MQIKSVKVLYMITFQWISRKKINLKNAMYERKCEYKQFQTKNTI